MFFRCWKYAGFLGLALALPALLPQTGAAASLPVTLGGHLPAAAARLAPAGFLPATNQLHLAFALPSRDPAGLQALLQALYDPASAQFHRFMTPAEFATRFGASEADYARVKAFARRQGLRITAEHSNRLVLDVAGSVEAIEKGFQLSLRRYAHPLEAREFFAPDREPQLEAEVGHLIRHISGLDNFSLARTHFQKTPPDVTPAAGAAVITNGTGISGSFMGRDFRNAYVPGSSFTGQGQAVGLVQFSGYSAADINYYTATAGISSVTLHDVLFGGATGATGQYGEEEVCLDIEMVASMAPQATIVVYEGPNDNSHWVSLLSQIANDNLAKQISCSWFNPGGTADASAEVVFQQMAVQGQTFFAASGDKGAYAGQIPFPDESPTITIVGGTVLTMTNGAYYTEKGWSGSGGGSSTYYPIPSWQQPVDMSLNHGSSTMRNIPDVSMPARNVYVRAGGADTITGGTSCAAPLWGGYMALVNQYADSVGAPPVGFLNPALYALALGSRYAAALHDVTTGSNTTSNDPSFYSAVPGYDLCTGWGSPNGEGLIHYLVSPFGITPTTPTVFAGPVGGPFGAGQFQVLNRATNAVYWSASVSAGWMSVVPASGTLAPGDPAAVVSLSFTPAAATLPAGSYAGSIIFSNASDAITVLRDVTLAICTAPGIVTQPTNQVVEEGQLAAFGVGMATNGLLYYQWQCNGTNLMDDGNVAGATLASLSILHTATNQAGTYAVIVSNLQGAVVSSNASLSVLAGPPVIIKTPAATVYGFPEQNISLAVVAMGSLPMNCQWRFNGVALTNGGALSGVNDWVLQLTDIDIAQSGNYALVISNAHGTVTSSVTQITFSPSCTWSVNAKRMYSFAPAGYIVPGNNNELTQAPDGSFFGVNALDGTNGGGAIFRFSTNGDYATLWSFRSSESPVGSLLLGQDGRFYGVAQYGGVNNSGFIYALATNGTLTTISSCSWQGGCTPAGSLVQMADGLLYGAVNVGGIFGKGAVFRLSTNGVFTTLVSFFGLNGSKPTGRLICAPDGYLYGVTCLEGGHGFGNVFRCSTNGDLTVIYDFTTSITGSSMAEWTDGLTCGPDGTLYGVVARGGANSYGMLFSLTPDGVFSNLYSFDLATGAYPFRRVLFAADGNLYCSTSHGGWAEMGSVLRFTPSGGFDSDLDWLRTGACVFTGGYQGFQPCTPLMQAADGNLYGVTLYGGQNYTPSWPANGTIFRVSPAGASTVITAHPTGAALPAGHAATFSVATKGMILTNCQWRKDGSALTESTHCSGTTTRRLTVSGIGDADKGSYRVVVNGLASSNAALNVVPQVQITNAALPAATLGLPYQVVLAATNGLPPYAWGSWASSGYAESAAANSFVTSGVAQGDAAQYFLHAWQVKLPFTFPFYGQNYTQCWVDSLGGICFQPYMLSPPATNRFSGTPMVAALWADMSTYGGEIYVATNSTQALFRWSEQYASGGAVNCSVVLTSNGVIRLSYGTGNAKGGLIGVSSGDHTNFQFSVHNQQGSMTSAADILFTPTLTNQGLPCGLTLGTNGLIAGIPSVIGTNVIQIAAHDKFDQATNVFALIVLRVYAQRGTPLDWLASYGLTNRDWTTAELADDDGDGVPNWQEYLADTDPTNAQSKLGMQALTCQTNNISLAWLGGRWAWQVLERKSNLLDVTPWVPLWSNNTLPTPSSNTFIDLAGTNAMQFYRLRVFR